MSLRPVVRIFNPRSLRLALAPSSRGLYRRHLGPPWMSQGPWSQGPWARNVAEMMEKFEQMVGKENVGPFPRWRCEMREVTLYQNKLEINLDLKEFTPEEIKVTQENQVLKVEASHEKRVEENEAFGLVSREIKREYVLPEGVDLDSLSSKFSESGFLTITAKVKGEKYSGGKEIPISRQEPKNFENQ